MYLTNLELTHPGAMDLIDSDILGAARRLIPGSLCDIGRTMEKTFMKFTKEAGTFVSPILVKIYFH